MNIYAIFYGNDMGDGQIVYVTGDYPMEAFIKIADGVGKDSQQVFIIKE